MGLVFINGQRVMQINKLLYSLGNLHRFPRFLFQYIRFRRLVTDWDCHFSEVLPMLSDRTALMGFDAHSVYHTAWATRVLKEINPTQHVDISSSIIFCGIASAFIPIRHYDFRKPILALPGLECDRQDVTRLSFPDSSISSLSCMHVIEHIGLGRYGDPINPCGDELAANELTRVLAPGGHLLIVLPLAQRARIRFNGHRIYSLEKVKLLFDGLELVEFSFLNDGKGDLFTRHATEKDIQGSDYGCGCFVFRKSITNQ